MSSSIIPFSPSTWAVNQANQTFNLKSNDNFAICGGKAIGRITSNTAIATAALIETVFFAVLTASTCFLYIFSETAGIPTSLANRTALAANAALSSTSNIFNTLLCRSPRSREVQPIREEKPTPTAPEKSKVEKVRAFISANKYTIAKVAAGTVVTGLVLYYVGIPLASRAWEKLTTSPLPAPTKIMDQTPAAAAHQAAFAERLRNAFESPQVKDSASGLGLDQTPAAEAHQAAFTERLRNAFGSSPQVNGSASGIGINQTPAAEAHQAAFAERLRNAFGSFPQVNDSASGIGINQTPAAEAHQAAFAERLRNAFGSFPQVNGSASGIGVNQTLAAEAHQAAFVERLKHSMNQYVYDQFQNGCAAIRNMLFV